MSAKGVATRLLIKPGYAVFPISAPKNYEEILGQLPPAARIVTNESELPADLVHVFAGTRAQLAGLLPAAMKAVRPGGMLWVSYPKVTVGGHDLSRQVVHNDLHTSRWKPVSQIALDDVWSAIRARPATDAERKA
ncbi:MAG: hypothetical protein ACRDRS_01510 [Pseudonocardiaceae bacterium]